MNKTSLYLGTLVLLLVGLIARLRAVFRVEVPVGYQDENGFHTGVQPTQDKNNWPPSW